MVKSRYSCLPPRKSSSSTLILTLLMMFTFLILILLALGILFVPNSSGSRDLPKANDLNSIIRNTHDRSEGEEGRGEQWVEIISWEPQAFVYHDFLVMQCQTEDECAELARNLPPIEAALLDWVINFMVDIVHQEHLNKII